MAELPGAVLQTIVGDIPETVWKIILIAEEGLQDYQPSAHVAEQS